MFFALLLLITIISGALVTYLYDQDAPPAARLCAGACIGFAALGLIGLISASFLGLTPVALVLTALFIASPFLLLLDTKRRAEVRGDLAASVRSVRRAILHPTLSATGYFIFYALVSILLWHVFDRAMFERADGIYTGAVNNYGDLPFHLSVITRFVYGENFPPEDPTYAGVRFTYPFLTDLLAAMFVRAGASLRRAMFVENFLLGLAFVGLVHRWVWELTRDRIAAVLSPVLVLLSGGLGWWLFLREIRKSEQGLFAMLGQLSHDYTIMPDSVWRWGNSLTTLLVTQRGILLGLPLAVIVFTQWWLALEDCEKGEEPTEERKKKAKDKNKKPPASASLSPSSFFHSPPIRRMIAAGAVAGLLPLAHAHSLVVVMSVGACYAVLLMIMWMGHGRLARGWRLWAAFFAVASIIAVPQMWWATHDSAVHAGSFFEWHLGWDRGAEHPIWFWFKNTGL
ncbi:MAG TPA: hypothetical protein VD966_06555, partial [Pyrinomonadaceae bacterium]|nr:hypothetical protein [Pyrinomonadaceae bacterium]